MGRVLDSLRPKSCEIDGRTSRQPWLWKISGIRLIGPLFVMTTIFEVTTHYHMARMAHLGVAEKCIFSSPTTRQTTFKSFVCKAPHDPLAEFFLTIWAIESLFATPTVKICSGASCKKASHQI